MKHHTIKALLASLLLTGAITTAASEDDAPPSEAIAIFAGGCFWCMEPPYDELPGVLSSTSGYVGGHVKNPSYKQVSAGGTGHTEAVEIRYDPGLVSYAKLLNVFWRNVDPFAVDRQFCDRGSQYRSGIYTLDDNQRELAEQSAAAVAAHFDTLDIATEIEPAKTFYAAEKYHQDYYQKNPLRYKYYRYNCGRDRRLNQVWGELDADADLTATGGE